MRNRIFAVLAIAVLAGGGLAYGTYNAINAKPVVTTNQKFQPVVVAVNDLQMGAEIRLEDLMVAAYREAKKKAEERGHRRRRLRAARHPRRRARDREPDQ